MYDVVVVGAGPSGSCAAIRCAEAGLKVILLDRDYFPRDKACGGAVGESTVKTIGKDVLAVSESEAWMNDIFYDNGYVGQIEGHEYFFKRLKLDHFLVRKAVSTGVELREGACATGVTITRHSATVHSTAGDFEARLVIAADGIYSAIARSLGLAYRDQNCMFASIRAEIALSRQKANELGVVDPARQQTHFFSDLVGFAWLIPNNGGVNAGCGSTRSRSSRLKEHFRRFLGGMGLRSDLWRGGQIPFTTLRRVYAERVLFTGDAAGFVNPWTGAGIDQGVRASENAAIVCKAAFDSDDFSAEKLRAYQSLCAGQIRRTNWRGSWVKVLDTLMPPDAKFPSWFRLFVKGFSRIA